MLRICNMKKNLYKHEKYTIFNNNDNINVKMNIICFTKFRNTALNFNNLTIH